ncbi:hypothetical protein BKA59DRAFT_487390 [Fusarium tricinctum]|uniref:Uncharacterized protein n=1 Tax=Fusarium tricinctum TaxID=61284 RepID=A0A8K0RL58_9HYPO|nr:hypothetical protein BKA59DRAFT_487390 [Fusarium tricinctum]
MGFPMSFVGLDLGWGSRLWVELILPTLSVFCDSDASSPLCWPGSSLATELDATCLLSSKRWRHLAFLLVL